MNHNTAFIDSILQLRAGLDSWDFKLDYDIIKVYFSSLLITLLTHKLTASFWKSAKNWPKIWYQIQWQALQLKHVITDICYVYIFFYWLLTLLMETFSLL